MVKDIIKQMVHTVSQLQKDLNDDIEDVKNANHEQLLDRNDVKLEKMDQIAHLKSELNSQLSLEIQDGIDVNIYRDDVDALEKQLLILSKLNTKLAAIVLPVQEMYREIIEDISKINGGTMLEVHA